MGRKVVTGSENSHVRSFDVKMERKIGWMLKGHLELGEVWFLPMFECQWE